MRVGFLTCCSYRVNRELVLAIRKEALGQLEQLCKELGMELCAIPGAATSDEELGQRLDALAGRRPDVFVLHYAGWTEDETVLRIFASFSCPMFLWATRDEFVEGASQLVAHVGYMEAVSVLRKAGHRVPRFFGGPNDESRKTLAAFLRAARTWQWLQGLRFGVIGHGYGCQGILDAVFDEEALKEQLGIEVVRIDLNELFARYRSISPAEAMDREKLADTFGLDVSFLSGTDVAEPQVTTDSVRLLWAIREISRDWDLKALSIRCFPEFKENNVPTPCLAVSVMNDIGIPTSCEGDILAGVSMLVLSCLTGMPATMMDVFSYDEPGNLMHLAHCGCASKELADAPAACRYKTHCKPRVHRAGVTVEFPLRESPVSMLKIDYLGERFKLYFYRGRSVSPSFFLRGTQADVQTEMAVRHLIEALLDEGVGHHQILSLGDVSREAAFFSGLAGVELIRPKGDGP